MKVISAFLRENLKYILGFVMIMILVFMVIQWQRADKYYDKFLESEKDLQEKNKAYIELKKESDSEKERLAKERDDEADARAKRDREIVRMRAADKKKDAELVKAKAKIKELTPDELTSKLNARVPGQYTLLGTEDFSLTRRGGEATLSLFMDGERCAGKLSERDSEIESYKNNEISFNAEILNLNTALTSTETTLAGCDQARLQAIESKENLHKAYKSVKWKSLGKGIAGGTILTLIALKLLRVI